MKLASRFASHSPSLRSSSPLTDDQIRAVAPSIFAVDKHVSRSDRYTYIPTGDVLTALRKEGFEPFMVCQTRVRQDDRRDFTKHMVRMRHARHIGDAEANEIVLLNSHDGTSSYQLISGLYRYVCSNGLVFGDTFSDVRVHHKGEIVDRVIEGAYEVLDGFDLVRERRDGMRAITLDAGEQAVFARAALALKYEPDPLKPAPITEAQVLEPRRAEDMRSDLWATFNRTQESLVNGGLLGRGATGRRMRTRPVLGIEQNVKLNRALWMLAEEMRRLKG